MKRGGRRGWSERHRDFGRADRMISEPLIFRQDRTQGRMVEVEPARGEASPILEISPMRRVRNEPVHRMAILRESRPSAVVPGENTPKGWMIAVEPSRREIATCVEILETCVDRVRSKILGNRTRKPKHTLRCAQNGRRFLPVMPNRRHGVAAGSRRRSVSLSSLCGRQGDQYGAASGQKQEKPRHR